MLQSAEEKDSSELTNCKIFLGYTSNMASCGVREGSVEINSRSDKLCFSQSLIADRDTLIHFF